MEDSNEGIGFFLNLMHGFKRISKEREVELSLILNNPKSTELEKDLASKELVESNLPLVVHVAKRYLPVFVNMFKIQLTLKDLVEWGSLGLVKASRSFDHTKAGFSTFAYNGIAWAIFEGIDEQKLIRVAESTLSRMKRIRKFIERFSEDTILTDKFIAKKIELKESTVKHMRETMFANNNVTSLEDLQEKGLDFADDNADFFKVMDQTDLQEIVKEKLNRLPGTMKDIIYSYYFQGKNTRELAVIHKCSHQNICNIINRGLRRLQRELTIVKYNRGSRNKFGKKKEEVKDGRKINVSVRANRISWQ